MSGLTEMFREVISKRTLPNSKHSASSYVSASQKAATGKWSGKKAKVKSKKAKMESVK